eukprot:11059-Heterococcus_DN1.PRE.1
MSVVSEQSALPSQDINTLMYLCERDWLLLCNRAYMYTVSAALFACTVTMLCYRYTAYPVTVSQSIACSA